MRCTAPWSTRKNRAASSSSPTISAVTPGSCCAASWASRAPASTTGAGRPWTGPPGGRRRLGRPDTGRVPGIGRHYGVSRITAEFREDGERANHKRIVRVMRSIGLAGLRPRRRHRRSTTDGERIRRAGRGTG
ncbi:IS3 family transposase [Streptomyces sp. SCSIO 30461]|uniref:IS3 family transposase n=1 Tax=Streptomyces sp. SCSIO 30461 TaxID=3118085 RepID=UPI00387E2F56